MGLDNWEIEGEEDPDDDDNDDVEGEYDEVVNESDMKKTATK